MTQDTHNTGDARFTDGFPLDAAVGILHADKRLEWVFELGEEVPTARRRVTCQTERDLKAGASGESLSFPIVRGSGRKRHSVFGAAVVPAERLSEDLPAGSRVVLGLRLDEAHFLSISVYLPASEDVIDDALELGRPAARPRPVAKAAVAAPSEEPANEEPAAAATPAAKPPEEPKREEPPAQESSPDASDMAVTAAIAASLAGEPAATDTAPVAVDAASAAADAEPVATGAGPVSPADVTEEPGSEASPADAGLVADEAVGEAPPAERPPVEELASAVLPVAPAVLAEAAAEKTATEDAPTEEIRTTETPAEEAALPQSPPAVAPSTEPPLTDVENTGAVSKVANMIPTAPAEPAPRSPILIPVGRRPAGVNAGPSGAQPAAAPAQSWPGDEDGGGRRGRRWSILALVVVCALLALVAAFAAFRGGSTKGSVASPSATPTATASASASPSPIVTTGSTVHVKRPGFPVRIAGVEVTKTAGALVLTPRHGLFESASAVVSEAGRNMLRQLAGQLRGRTDGLRVLVIGHTDIVPMHGVGLVADNVSLGMARAVSVVEFLRLQPGLPYDVFAAATADGSDPVDTNTTASGRERNRTVVIKLMKVIKTSK